MARKGWDNLSERYRSRLLHNHISREDYESGSSLWRARGKRSQAHEAFTKRTTTFVHRFGLPGDSPDGYIERIRDLGPVAGQEYMDYRREMVKLYMSGHHSEASAMYARRNTNWGMSSSDWYYHGLFG
jgi:hypothetical protein